MHIKKKNLSIYALRVAVGALRGHTSQEHVSSHGYVDTS